MELRITEYKAPEVIECNYEELKASISQKCEEYKAMVYDDGSIKAAKADRATLNKFKKALNDERIKREREYMAPFAVFKGQVAELVKMIDEPVAVIDAQVKNFEARQRGEKLAELEEHFNGLKKPFEELTFRQVFEERWLNSSVSMKKAKEEMENKLNEISSSIETLGNLPEFGFEAVEVYKRTLDIAHAVDEAQRISSAIKAKAEREAQLAAMAEEAKSKRDEQKVERVEYAEPETQEQPRQWITFTACMNTYEAMALRQFFNDNNIEFKKA